jgi:SAM-dependent methyltransferase
MALAFPQGKIEKGVALNVGSGTKRLHKEIVNVDVYPFRHVDVVARLEALPFKEEVADMIICDSVLEHVEAVGAAIQEVRRVIKKGGYLYVTVPFLYPFHASPNDYYRWTKEGLRASFPEFELVQQGMRGGPLGTLQGVLAYIFATILSFGSETIYHFLVHLCMLLLAPLKLLDVIVMRMKYADEVGSHLYFLGRKK